ncbi:MAG: 50S ribosomal protein L30 [Betaproteobacteria bacterium]|nr:MAG: 50S ribosomal protein L30 [Betaproteobacteria bacterium]TMH53259.1 MAG: 50S ribosomal protein L30 [Betaproteobacteria bacterium]TMH99817.1 MAG: 50S ribosomal protein L30 [Betaproteobacteria bacterium]
MAAEKQVGKVRITLIKGLRGKKDDHRATVRGLGLKWRSHTVELDDTPEVRGMIGKVAYMLSVTEGRQG